jgi:prepilin-type N-terminal cleavage/methylation domain-containing protein
MIRLRAFTLTEVMAVLVLSAITMGILWSFLELTRTQYAGQQQQLDDVTRLGALHACLNRDFYTCDDAYLTENSLIFTFPGEVRRYRFADEGIRRQISTATGPDELFPLTVVTQTPVFLGDVAADPPPLRALTLVVRQGPDTIRLEFEKAYEAKYLKPALPAH